MDLLMEELTAGLTDWHETWRMVIRLVASMLLGAVVGIQRQRAGKAAGVRTHMLVAMGSTLFVISCTASGMSSEGLSRVIQGLATGIGFIGAGSILKRQTSREIEGLTTAAGIWMTAATGVAVGLGKIGLAALGVLLTWMVLVLAGYVREALGSDEPEKTRAGSDGDREG